MRIHSLSGILLLEINDAAGTIQEMVNLCVEDLDLKSQNLNEAEIKNIAFTLADMDRVQLLGSDFCNVYFEGVWLCDARPE